MVLICSPVEARIVVSIFVATQKVRRFEHLLPTKIRNYYLTLIN